jgi:hypothetical protein
MNAQSSKSSASDGKEIPCRGDRKSGVRGNAKILRPMVNATSDSKTVAAKTAFCKARGNTKASASHR